MSPLWRDEIRIFVGPRRVALARMQRGLRPQCVAESSATVERASEGDWQATRRTLAEQLAQPVWRDAVVHAVIGDHWVRYALVPWSDALRDEAERQAYARHVLATLFGDVSSQWTLAMSHYVHASSRVVSALPTELLDDLRSMLDSNGLRLVSAQPQLVAAYNSWRHRLPEGAAWFVSVEDGLLAAAHQSDTGWDVVHAIRVRGDWCGEFDRLRKLRRLERGDGVDGPVYVHGPTAMRSTRCRYADDLKWLEREPGSATTGELQLLKGLCQ